MPDPNRSRFAALFRGCRAGATLLCTLAVATAPSLAAQGLQGCLDRFAEQAPRATEWVLTPLETPVPGQVRETIAALDAGLRDEAARTPQASVDAYRYAIGICQTLSAVLDERDAALAKSAARPGGRSGISEAGRKAWFDRAWVVGPGVEKSFAQFRETIRTSPPPAAPVAQDRSSDFEFPPAPERPSPDAHEVAPPTPAALAVNGPAPLADAFPVAPRGAAPGVPAGPQAPPSPGAPALGAPVPGAPPLGGGNGGPKLGIDNGGLNRGGYDSRKVWSQKGSTLPSIFYNVPNGVGVNVVTPYPVNQPRNVPRVAAPNVPANFFAPVTINGVAKTRRIWMSRYGLYYQWTYSY